MATKTASLYVIGTELTRGIISDTHIPFLSDELTKLGFAVKRAQIVPDDGSIGKDLELVAHDSDVILVTGGLGPTCDDLTRNIIAKVANVPLLKNQEAWDTLYQRVGERIYGANEVQAMIPSGFDIIPNPNGTACGFKGSFTLNSKKTDIVCMPGPPAEMRPMFYDYVKGFLASLIGAKLETRDSYSVFLIAEAKLDELCQQCAIPGVSWGTRFQAFSISLYVNGSNDADRKTFIERLRKLAGEGLIVDGDNVTVVSLLTDFLKENNYTISCAESCTSGLIAKLLTDQSGSSSYFWGGCATYDNMAKQKLLGVKKETLDSVGAVSSQVAIQMAQGIRDISNTDVAVSVTGIAGPTGAVEGKPVGTIYIGLSAKGKESIAVRLNITARNREACRKRFATSALLLTLYYLTKEQVIDIPLSWVYI